MPRQRNEGEARVKILRGLWGSTPVQPSLIQGCERHQVNVDGIGVLLEDSEYHFVKDQAIAIGQPWQESVRIYARLKKERNQATLVDLDEPVDGETCSCPDQAEAALAEIPFLLFRGGAGATYVPK